MKSKFFKRVAGVILMMSFVFAPINFSFAQVSIQDEQEKLQALMLQVKVLLVEVVRLQTMLLEYQSGVLPEEVSSEEIDNIVSRSVIWFKNAQEEDGHFRYEYVPYENKYLNDDNIVRQAGAMYVLGEVLRRDTNNVHDLKENVERAALYFEKLSLRDEYEGRQLQCVVSKEGSRTCVLGTTSLVLIGLIDLVKRYPALSSVYADRISDYAAYILATKKEGAGFRNYHYVGREEQNDKESSFSTGEALLALVRYYEFHPTDEVKQVIDDTFEYMQNDMPFDFGLYLWAMAALKEMQQIVPNDEYVSYVKDYTDWRMVNFERYRGSTHNMCAYAEGVISAYSVLEPSSTNEEKEKYLEDINYWLGQSAKLQITKKDTDRLVYNNDTAYFATFADPDRAIGGFLTDKNELTQRIDFTQHCLSSFIQKKVDIDGGVIAAP
ncbi:MAG: hypothetical protein KAS07_03170 [Candidatus Pacebacteria bacterium]|nr:hypothetical protein [Candidatus Paceibacterota bacterium]